MPRGVRIRERQKVPKRPPRALLAERIAARLRRSIIMGDVEPGANLYQAELAAQFRTSLSPVREACGRLAREGLLHFIPRKGYAVSEVGIDEIRDIFEMREMLEPEAAARLAARGLDEVRRERLARLLRELTELAARPANRETYHKTYDLDLQWHEALAEGTGNKILARTVRECLNSIRRLWYVRWQQSHAAQTRPTTIREHEEIHAAIMSRQPEAARELMRQHVRTGFQRYYTVLGGGMLNLDGQPRGSAAVEQIQVSVEPTAETLTEVGQPFSQANAKA